MRAIVKISRHTYERFCSAKNMGISISLCMIVKNEENDLANCLNSVKDLVEEINIIDTGSTDKTTEIAKQYTDRIYHFDWIDDFSAARNFSFSKATKDYILWLDADDTITDENRAKFLELKKNMEPHWDYVEMIYNYLYDENGNLRQKMTRERLLKRSVGFKWSGAVHESITLTGSGLQTDICINHNMVTNDSKAIEASTKRNIRILEKVYNSGNPTWKDLYYYGLSLEAVGDLDRALEVFKQMFITPNNTSLSGINAYLCTYKIYILKDDKESALKVLKDNEHLFYDKAEYYCRIGDYYNFEAGVLDVACEYYIKALTCKGYDPDGTFSSRDENYYYFIPFSRIGKLLSRFKMYYEALSYFEKALIFRPNDSDVISAIEQIEKERHGS